MEIYEKTYKLTFTDPLLGTMPGNKEIYLDYVAKKAETAEEEAEAIPVDETIEKGTTVFPRAADDKPFIWDYQLRGYFKEACKFLKKVADTKSSKEKAYKQKIDGLIFVKDRQNVIEVNGEIGICERPLRASTPQGDRVALSRSEEIPAGSTITFTVQVFAKSDFALVEEWLDYGKLHGTGQWRNAGRGRFLWNGINEEGRLFGGNNTAVVE